MAAAFVAHRNVAVVVATRTALPSLEQRRDRLAFMQAAVTP